MMDEQQIVKEFGRKAS